MIGRQSYPGASTDVVIPLDSGRILVVEDDTAIAEQLRHVLEADGHLVWVANEGAQAEALLADLRFDVVLLDLILPDVDGLALCSQIRVKWGAAVVVVSATRRDRDRILSLRLGADDFISKPFEFRELVARVEAVLRRASARRASPSVGPFAAVDGDVAEVHLDGGSQGWPDRRRFEQAYRLGSLAIDPRRRRVTISGRLVYLTPTENRLLTTMTTEPERVFSRTELAEELWGVDSLGESRAIDVHVRRLRAKLKPFGVAAPTVVTVRGFGYKAVRGSSSAGSRN